MFPVSSPAPVQFLTKRIYLSHRYFRAATPSTERHLYSVPIPTSSSHIAIEPKPLTDTMKPGYFSTRFSPGAAFYVLNYHGPSTPWTKVVDVDRPGAFCL